MEKSSIVLGLDASRNRSGGAINHLIGVLSNSDPTLYGIGQIHIWSYKNLLNKLPDTQWLIKHYPKELEESLVKQVLWQVFSLPKEIRKTGCDLLLNTDAGTLCSYKPSITMSRDMLSYEPGEMNRFGFSRARLRLIILKYIQNRSLKNSSAAIFLTNYASTVIQKHTGPIDRFAIIPHGVGGSFSQIVKKEDFDGGDPSPVQIIYISNIAMHKHQWNVVSAIAQLNRSGYKVRLTLAGGIGYGRPADLLNKAIEINDPKKELVHVTGHVEHDQLPNLLNQADIFVFASSCENMPNTLIEAMASGLPIACSNRGPMPEILEDAGVYFDPDDPDSIASSLIKIITNKELRYSIAEKAHKLSRQYSWNRCAEETWKYCSEIASRI